LEAEQVASQWSRAGQNARTPQPQVLRLSGSEAGEAAFKRLASGQSIVHIATHGFFAHDRCRSSLDELYSADTGPPLARRPDSPGADNPLILSGLALAGANRRHELDPSENVEDGILTAEELASLDLSEAQLVVLSACETASGKLQAGEGVLGLRRALAIAGARTAVMSLWPVQDEATREWMVEFYRSRLSGGSTADSVRRAALAIKKARGHAGKDTHPFYWAAFVASGDWR
jgi:CHAT domain-containing protein